MNGMSTLNVAVSVSHVRHSNRQTCEGIAAYAHTRSDWRLTLFERDEAARADLSGFDGFVWDVFDAETARRLTSTGKPVIDMTNEGIFPGTVAVLADHLACGQLAARHFLTRHLSHFAFCGWKDLNFSKAREASYRRALELNRYDCATYHAKETELKRFAADIVERLVYPSYAKSLAKWLQRLPKPVGVFCANDLMAWQVVEVCVRQELSVPGEIAVLGADNDTLPCLFTSVPISSIDTAAFEIGRRAGQTLDELMRGVRKVGDGAVRVKPIGVETRLSSETYPLDPPWMAGALTFIRSGVVRALSASDVVAHIGLSASTVEHAFKRVLGRTIQKEITEARLDEAEHLLSSSSLTLQEVAARTGFSSQQYFCNCFQRRNGVSPGAWRSGGG